MNRSSVRTLAICTLSLLLIDSALARIKLTTLPVRERVEVQFDHPNQTLIEEERIVPMVQGINQVDFAWANTLIDPSSLVFQVVSEPNPASTPVQANILSVSYPPNENALIWSIAADRSGPVRVRISYLLGGLDKKFHYRALAATDEQTLTLSQYLRIDNLANEGYPDSVIWPGFGEQLVRPIGQNESKDVLLHKFRDVPLRKTYTADVAEHGYLDATQHKLNIPMHYVLDNTRTSGLGQFALAAGKARIFQQDGHGSQAFLGEDWGRFTPPDDELSLYLGLAQDIVVRRTIDRNERTRLAGNAYRQDITIKYEIENFKNSPATLNIVEHPSLIRDQLIGHSSLEPEWTLGSDTTLPPADADHSDYSKLQFKLELPAQESSGEARKLVHRLHIRYNNQL